MEKNQVISVSESNGAFMFTCACKAELCNGHWDASINGTANCYPWILKTNKIVAAFDSNELYDILCKFISTSRMHLDYFYCLNDMCPSNFL